MILGVPFSVYSPEYIFFNITHGSRTVIQNSRFRSAEQTSFPITYSTEHVIMNDLSVVLDSDIDIEDNLIRLENDIIEEFASIGRVQYHTLISVWEKHIKDEKYTDQVLLTCKGLKLHNDLYTPIFIIAPIP